MSIVGTRPELIKMSEIIKKLDKYTEHVFVHTGQNYAYELNEIFYDELGLRKPDHYLNVAGGSLGETIGNVLKETERVMLEEKPDAVVILGDTNSGLSGIMAKRLKIPFFHLEAGNRCFDHNVPEEINRRILDHTADVNMVYTENSRRYLLDEGVAKDRIFVMGSPMKEILYTHRDKIKQSKILDTLDLKPEQYFVASLHRDENTEIQSNFDKLVESLNAVAEKYGLPVILSTHPRLMKKIEAQEVKFHDNVVISQPFGFFDYVYLQAKAKCTISDSGTIAEESSVLGFPAITIRNAIERPEAVDVGSILIAGVDKDSVLNCLDIVEKPTTIPADYDVKNCSDRVLKVILGYTNYVNRFVWHKVGV
jgi:UDP-N-acetylglucosamine 2-epimerase (non-hydrolysing)